MNGRFVISTGRSGSTLLSRMLAENRRLLVLSEFISCLDNATRFRDGTPDGRAFAQILSVDDDLSALIAARGRPSAEALFEGGPASDTSTGRSPSMVRACLPTLTGQPEQLFAEMIGVVRQWPERTVRDHYHALFDWLCERLGKDMWIERSGFGIRLLSGIRRTFPDARYLHLHRDGLEAAISMRDHPWFRVGISFDFAPPRADEVRDAILCPQPAKDDLVSRLLDHPPPVALYGRHWTNLLARAFREIRLIDAGQYRELRFEDLVADPKRALDELAAWFELPGDPGWTERAAALVKSDLKPRADALSENEREALEAACRPGQILLGRADPARLDESLALLREAFTAIKQERETKHG